MKNIIVFTLLGILLFIIGIPVFLYFIFSQSSENYLLSSNPVSLFETPDPDYIPKNSVEIRAYEQIGIVTEYDMSNGYYAGGIPPKHIGVCTDVIIQALRDNGYDLQQKVFEDIKKYPNRYLDTPDKNINHRRVKNLKVFFDEYFISLPTEINKNTLHTWQAGDIVTYEKIPGKLWHIGIVSGEKTKRGVPFLIDNHGNGTQVSDILERWPSPISGHYRVRE